ncbi:MAG: DNA-directed RNA polymerase subunit alpha [Elusimicrobia bacterium]|nr:DNA-directed RNA polymerase subunit alpha [Elusimicrobiota bacterium]
MKTPDLEKLRRLTADEKTQNEFYGCFTAEPFERGYGHTIGNSLRRILLSSLEGAAITSMKVAGALHEFAVLKGVKEDVAQIVLNVKKIRVKMHSEGPEKLYLKVKKAGKITAKDIEKNASVKILNPEAEIANLDAGASLEIEFEVRKGHGYVVADEIKNAGKYSVGTIALDALFSPVSKVNYEVENTRVEQIMNYDKLIMEIWTDGSLSPKDALAESAKILKNSLNIFTGAMPNACAEEEVAAEPSGEDVKLAELLDQPLSILDLSTRSSNSLKNEGLETIRDLIKFTEEDAMQFSNFGKRSLDEIVEKLSELGLSLAGSKGEAE